MSEPHELDPGVKKLRKRLGRSEVPARYLFTLIDGANRNGDIAEQLVASGAYPNMNTAVVTVSIMTRNINSLAVEQWGEPLIVKASAYGGYSCSAGLAEQFTAVRSALLPMDMSVDDPTLFMDDAETERYRYEEPRYRQLSEIVGEISANLVDLTTNRAHTLESGGASVYLPKKGLMKFYSIVGGDEADAFTGVLDKQQIYALQMSATKAQALNEVSYALVGGQLVEVRKVGSQGKVRNQYEIDHDTLSRIADIGRERANMPSMSLEPDDVPVLEASINLVNTFMSGGLRELGFVYTMGLRDSLVVRDMLERCEFSNPALLARRKQLLLVMNMRLANWSVERKKDVRYKKLLQGIHAEGRPEGGACGGVDPDLFFPERGESTRESKAVCNGCEQRKPCLEFALDNGEKFGIWGGLSERERRRLRRKRSAESKAAKIALQDLSFTAEDQDDAEELETA